MHRVLPTLCLLAVVAAPVRAADEAGFWTTWKTHLAATNEHTEAVAACDAFEKKNPSDPLVVVTRQLKAWHLLKLGRNEAAAALLVPMVKPGAEGLNKAASDIARAWLTRLDRERVKAALQDIYRRDVAYPEKLDVWKGSSRKAPPLVDRWGKRWKYRLVGYSRLPGLRDQKYELQAILLGDVSDLATALELAYGEQISLRPARLKRTASGPPLVQFERGESGGKAIMAVGTRNERTFFAYMGDRIIAVADYTHWKVLPKPR